MNMLSWKQAVTRHQEPVLRKSIWQVINTLIPYLTLCGVMIWSLDVSYWLTLAVAVAAGGFLIRIFIIFHDCGHGSFFRSRRTTNGGRSMPCTTRPRGIWIDGVPETSGR